jgi:hypothetical protein
MSDILQYRKVVELEFRLGEGETKINLQDAENNYYSKLDDINIDPKEVDLSQVILSKTGICLKFASPINCNIRSGRHYNSMMCGAELEGNDTSAFVEKINGLSTLFDEE